MAIIVLDENSLRVPSSRFRSLVPWQGPLKVKRGTSLSSGLLSVVAASPYLGNTIYDFVTKTTYYPGNGNPPPQCEFIRSTHDRIPTPLYVWNLDDGENYAFGYSHHNVLGGSSGVGTILFINLYQANADAVRYVVCSPSCRYHVDDEGSGRRYFSCNGQTVAFASATASHPANYCFVLKGAETNTNGGALIGYAGMGSYFERAGSGSAFIADTTGTTGWTTVGTGDSGSAGYSNTAWGRYYLGIWDKPLTGYIGGMAVWDRPLSIPEVRAVCRDPLGALLAPA